MMLMQRIDTWWVEASKRRRLDHSPANLCMIIGLMFPTLMIFLRGPVPQGAVAIMPVWLQIMMCACIFFGLGIKVHGAISGTRWYMPNKSLIKCYRNGYTGAPLAVTGLFVYSFYILDFTPDFWSAISAFLTPMMGLGIGLQAIAYWLESRRIEHNERMRLSVMRAMIQNTKASDGSDAS